MMEYKLSKAYPKHQIGRFKNLKNLSSAVLQLLLFITPWINWGGRQMVLLDIPGRKLHMFGWTFWPQETLFMFLLLMVAGLTLFCVTALLGRIWCGYACPQTIFSHSFIMVERWIEGDRFRRIKLDRSCWSKEKVSRKLAKWSAWLAMSVYLGITFAGYYTPIRPLFLDFVSGQAQPSTLMVIGFFTGVSMLFFGLLRGRFCTTICPYARLQGSMFDPDTVMVNYDSRRGEPRGKASDPKAGDCVDCGLCVAVCPQGIDIRNGVQFECINCAACVDACDSVMDKLEWPRGLIRHTSENELGGGRTHWLRSRPLMYAGTIVSVVAVFVLLLMARNPLEMDAVRASEDGVFTRTSDNRISNRYDVRLINKQSPTRQIRLSLEGFEGAELVVPVNPLTLKAESTELVRVFVLIDGSKVGPVHRFRIVATDVTEPECSREVETTFLRGER